MVLTKLLNNNITTNIISSNIIEYDLKAAHTSALYFIKGEEIYNKLMSLPKAERNQKIGLMIKFDPTLRKKIDTMVLSWFNLFLKENNILECNFLATTPDSILIYNQIATKTTFFDGKVFFRNKEGICYTSLFVIDRKFILFDRMSKRIRIKGLGIEEKTNTYPFVKYVLKDLCCILDDESTLGRMNCLKRLKLFRINYINNENIEIFRSIDDGNKLKYIVDGQPILSDVPLKESNTCILIKSDNYMNYVLPLIQSFI
jgi:hypothetical protein